MIVSNRPLYRRQVRIEESLHLKLRMEALTNQATVQELVNGIIKKHYKLK